MLKILQRLPLTEWKRSKAFFRRLFPTEWPESIDHVHVPDDVEVLEETLRESHWEDASGWSLYYDGEILNVRRPAGRGDDGTPLEDHLRARRVEVDDGTPLHRLEPRLEVIGHREPSRWEAKTAHVNEEGLEWFSGAQLAAILEEAGIPADVIEPAQTS